MKTAPPSVPRLSPITLRPQRRTNGEGGIKYDPLGPSCWFTYGDGRGFAPSHPFPAEAVAERIRLGWERGAANVLLATAPDHTGKMRPEDVEQLRRIGQILRENPVPSPP